MTLDILFNPNSLIRKPSHFARTFKNAQATVQTKVLIELAKPMQDKIVFKKISIPSQNKKRHA